ncbi:hypothetical protein FRB97_007706, partial [Tulasnella sp. 331]
IRRIYVQNGVVIQNAMSQVSGIQSTNAISTAFCDQQLGTTSPFEAVGGMKPLTTAFTTGMVLAVSLWDDASVDGMSWLDGAPNAGTCTTGVNTTAATVNATFSNIKFGDLNSTYSASPPAITSSMTSTLTSTNPTTTSLAPGPTQTHWGQCAGIGYT